jgi:hypothetical protein
VTEVGGKRRKLLLDIDPLAIPTEKGPDGEAMPEIVHPRPAMLAGAPQAERMEILNRTDAGQPELSPDRSYIHKQPSGLRVPM